MPHLAGTRTKSRSGIIFARNNEMDIRQIWRSYHHARLPSFYNDNTKVINSQYILFMYVLLTSGYMDNMFEYRNIIPYGSVYLLRHVIFHPFQPLYPLCHAPSIYTRFTPPPLSPSHNRLDNFTSSVDFWINRWH